jgi:hypothetical protein
MEFKPRHVPIDAGLSGQLWAKKGEWQLLLWDYHGWRFGRCELYDASGHYGPLNARNIIYVAKTRGLPAPHGVVFNDVGADSAPLIAEWVDGRVLITVVGKMPDFGMQIATAMRRWPTK